MKKKSFLTVLLIVLMCISLVFTGCQKAGDDDKGDNGTKATTGETGEGENKPQFEDPNDQVADAIEKTLSALVSADGVGAVLDEAVNGGKITVEVADMIENELYMDVSGNQYADILTISPTQGVYTEFGIYLQDSKLAVSAPALLGDEAYGVDFNTLLTDLKNAELWALLGTSYEEFMTQVGIDLEAAFDAVEKYMDAMPDGQAVIDSLKDVEVTREEGTVTINGESVKAVNVKYHVTSEDVHALLNACMDEAERSVDALKDALSDVMIDVDINEVVSDVEFSPSRQEIDDMFATMDLNGDLVVSIDPETQYIMNVSMDIAGTVNGEEGKIDMDLVLGTDPSNSDKVTFTVFGEADGERSGFTIESVRTTSGTVDTVTTTVNEIYDDETDTIATMVVSYDNSNGACEITMSDEFETTTIKGTYKVTADKFEVSIDSITEVYDDEEYTEEIGLRLVVEKINKSDIPEMPVMKNILKLTQDEWTELINKFAPAEPDDSYAEDYYDEDIYFGEYAA